MFIMDGNEYITIPGVFYPTTLGLPMPFSFDFNLEALRRSSRVFELKRKLTKQKVLFSLSGPFSPGPHSLALPFYFPAVPFFNPLGSSQLLFSLGFNCLTVLLYGFYHKESLKSIPSRRTFWKVFLDVLPYSSSLQTLLHKHSRRYFLDDILEGPFRRAFSMVHSEGPSRMLRARRTLIPRW